MESFQETVMLFMYAIGNLSLDINRFTLQRYLYLYYVTRSFLQNDSNDPVNIVFDKHLGVQILSFSEVLDRLEANNEIEIRDNKISATTNLIQKINLFPEEGELNDKKEETISFVNLLTSYDDDLIFSLIFKEPSATEAESRNENIIVSKSKLSQLLTEFYEQINNETINKYDVLSHWLNFIIQKVVSEG